MTKSMQLHVLKTDTEQNITECTTASPCICSQIWQQDCVARPKKHRLGQQRYIPRPGQHHNQGSTLDWAY